MINKVYIKEKILELINGQPGISAPQVAEKMGLSRVTAFRHIKNLISLQKIRSQGQGKATRYFPHESSYIASNIGTIRSIGFTQDQVHFLKQEVLFSIQETYNESETEENLDSIFDRYCMYIAPDDTIMTGFDAFLGWCTDPKDDFSDRIVKKAIEYLEIIGSIEYRRKKNGFLDGGESARMNLKGLMDIAFDWFYFGIPSVLENGFGRTRTALELHYGKLNNKYLLEQALGGWIDPIKDFTQKNRVDAIVFTPPTHNRTVQFRDLLESILGLQLPKLKVEKVPSLGRVLQPQKDIHDREARVNNAFLSLEVSLPKELNFYMHILILDDSFTTGATPNAIALKFRNAGYIGKISIITICGSFSYDLAITEDEV